MSFCYNFRKGKGISITDADGDRIYLLIDEITSPDKFTLDLRYEDASILLPFKANQSNFFRLTPEISIKFERIRKISESRGKNTSPNLRRQYIEFFINCPRRYTIRPTSYAKLEQELQARPSA